MSVFDAVFTATITIASQTGVSDDGEPAYGEQYTAKARIQYGLDRTQTSIEHSMVLYTSTPIDPTDRIWLPDDDVEDPNKARAPASVSSSDALGMGVTVVKVLI